MSRYSSEENAARRRVLASLKKTGSNLFVVRLWDMFDGWIDITEPVDREEANRVWNEKTANGTKKTTYDDGDYYRVFPADTRMIFTPEFMGR